MATKRGGFRQFLAAAAAVLLLVISGGGWSAGQKEEKSALPEEQHLIASLDGAVLFQAYCAPCHGRDGKGGGPAAPALKAPVPDLTQISKKNSGKFPATRVEKIISGEEEIRPAHGSREMPIWGPIFGQIAWDQDLGRVRIHNLTKYIESLQRK